MDTEDFVHISKVETKEETICGLQDEIKALKDKMESLALPEPYLEVDRELYFEPEYAVMRLLKDDVLFIALGDCVDQCVLMVICNDVFEWAYADLEYLPYDEIKNLWRMHETDDKWGSAKWCCLQRGMRPQRPVERAMREEGAWDDRLDALPARED